MRKVNPRLKSSVDPVHAPKSFDILLCGATALTSEPDQPIIEDCVVGIRGDRIALVASAAEAGATTADHIIDARDHVLTPGFINIHTHAVLAMVRGMTEDLGFAPAYTPGVPHCYDVTEEEAAALARLTALEAMLFGSTFINDMYTHAHATLPAMSELGLRICSSGWLHDVDFERVHEGIWDYRPQIGERTLQYGIDLYERWNGAFDGRAAVMLAPHAIDTCSRPFLMDVNRERHRLGVKVMTHLAQSRLEVEQVRRRDGMTPTEAVEDSGLLDDDLIAAHCVVMTAQDIARAGRAGITVAHAPKISFAGGYLPTTVAMRKAGANIALATDNMHADIVEVMRWALASARLQERAITADWTSNEVFDMTTLGSARCLGRDHELGSLKLGKKADLVLFDFRRAHLTPAFHPLGTLVHVGVGRDVSMVIVDGKIVVEQGRATLVDEEDIRRKAAAAAKSLWTRVAGEPPSPDLVARLSRGPSQGLPRS
jgi:5-methylthioadenosine/S-adenosylhomocysteine deaminase